MITRIIIVLVLYTLSVLIFIYGSKEKNPNKWFHYAVLNHFLTGIILAILFMVSLLIDDLRVKAQGKCPEITPVQEQLYKLK